MKVSVEKQRNIFGLVAPSPGYCLSESPSQKEGKQASADHAETQNARLNESPHKTVGKVEMFLAQAGMSRPR